MDKEIIIRWIVLKLQDLDEERLLWIYHFLRGYLAPRKRRQ